MLQGQREDENAERQPGAGQGEAPRQELGAEPGEYGDRKADEHREARWNARLLIARHVLVQPGVGTGQISSSRDRQEPAATEQKGQRSERSKERQPSVAILRA